MSVKLRSKKLAGGAESLYLDIYIKGNRHTESLDIKLKKNDPIRKQKKEIAEAKRAKRELDLLSDYHDVPRNYNGDDDFLEYFEKNAIDVSSRAMLSSFKDFLGNRIKKDQFPIKMISEKLIEEYKAYLEKDKKNSTVWIYLIKLKTILNKAVKDRLIPRNPGRYVKVKLNDIEKIYLTEEELRIMINKEFPELDKEVKRAFVFSCFTGLRISDIGNLTWSQIKEERLFYTQKKTRGVEYLPLSKTAKKYLYMDINIEEIKPTDKVFKLFDQQTTNAKLKKWAEKSEIDKKVTFHTGRHTFATLSLTSGIDIYTVSKLMGHKSVKMTEIYAKIINKSIDEAVLKLPEL